MQALKKIGWAILRGIDTLNIISAYIAGATIFILMVVIVYDIVMRYFFRAPTLWGFQLSTWLLCASALLVGGYALYLDGHVRIDIIHRGLTPRKRAGLELVMFLVFFAFAGAMVMGGYDMLAQAIRMGEKSPNSSVPWPMAPIYLTVPLGAGLLFLQGIARYVRNIITLITGREHVRIAEKLGGEE